MGAQVDTKRHFPDGNEQLPWCHEASYFGTRSIFLSTLFDAQQRTQAKRTGKLSLLVRDESNWEIIMPGNLSQIGSNERRRTGQPLWTVNCIMHIHT